MFGKWLKQKKAQYATCFAVCLLCLAFGLIGDMIQEKHKMLDYSLGFLIKHYHINAYLFDLKFEEPENDELKWTIEQKSAFPSREGNLIGNVIENKSCWDKEQEVLYCHELGFSIKEDLKSQLETSINSETHVAISLPKEDKSDSWVTLKFNQSSWDEMDPTIIVNTSYFVRDFVLGLQRKKILLKIYVHHGNPYPKVAQVSGSAVPEVSESSVEERIENLTHDIWRFPEISKFFSKGFSTELAIDLIPFYIGQILGAVLFGCLVNFIGRKEVLIIASLSLILSELLLLIPRKILYEYIVSFVVVPLFGFGLAGFYIVAPIYICEIAEDKVRGVLSSFSSLFVYLGATCSFLVNYLRQSSIITNNGAFLFYSYWSILILSIIFLEASYWLTESPSHLLLKNRTEEAKKAFVKLQRNDCGFEFENSTNGNLSNTTNGWIKNMTPNFATAKAFTICCFLLIVRCLSFNEYTENFGRGILAQYNYLLHTNNIFWANVSFSLLASVLVVVLIDRAGRRFLLLASCMGMAFCSFNLIFMFFAVSYLNDNSGLLESIYWLPVLSWAGFHFSFHLGIGCIPWILFSELLNAKARGPAMSFFFFILETFSFMCYCRLIPTNHIYLPAIQAVNSALGALLVYFYVPETKRKSVRVILNELCNKFDY